MNRLVSSSKVPVDLSLAGFVSGPQGAPQGTASAGDLWRILWRGRLIILSTVVVLFACTLVYCFLAPPRYTASAELFIDPRDRKVVANDVNPSSVASDGGVAQIETQARVVGSSAVLLRAIKAAHLTEDPDSAGSGRLAALLALFGIKPEAPSSPDEVLAEALRSLKQRLTIKRADRVFVVDVSVSARSAERAAREANAVVDAYLADQADDRGHAGEQAAAELSARLDAQRARVEADANAIEAYKRSNNILLAGGQLVGDKNLIDLNAALTAAQGRVNTLRANIDQIDRARKSHNSADATVEALQSTVISKLREQESGLVAHQAELEAKFGRRHPEITAIHSQLGNVRQLINAEVNRIAGAAHADYDRAVADAGLLAAQVQQARQSSEAVGQASVKLNELERDLEADRTVYGAFLVRAQEVREQAGIDTTNARVITRAIPPNAKSWPPLGILLAGAIGSGLGLGSGLALLREYVRPTILSSGQVERVVGAPVIAVLPGGAALRPSRSGAAALRGKRRRRGATYPRVLAMVGLALRRLYHIVGNEREATAVRSLVFTSNPYDGVQRHDVCQLFAAAARLRGERVLLILADGEDEHEDSGAGLAEVLRGDTALENVVARSAASKVATLSTGSELSAVAGDVSWNGARQLLADARSQFDLLVIDGGVLEENLAIAPLLAAADEVIFVGQLGRTSLSDVTGTAETAGILGRSISAIVLVDPVAAG
jgi:uncharacterized protein involved in exopolysaccharide biosynthesis/Mrp family chromosome partitioning ATPase